MCVCVCMYAFIYVVQKRRALFGLLAVSNPDKSIIPEGKGREESSDPPFTLYVTHFNPLGLVTFFLKSCYKSVLFFLLLNV